MHCLDGKHIIEQFSNSSDSLQSSAGGISRVADQGMYRNPHALDTGLSEQKLITLFNPLPTIGSSLKKQKRRYKVLTPSIKPPIIINM